MPDRDAGHLGRLRDIGVGQRRMHPPRRGSEPEAASQLNETNSDSDNAVETQRTAAHTGVYFQCGELLALLLPNLTTGHQVPAVSVCGTSPAQRRAPLTNAGGLAVLTGWLTTPRALDVLMVTTAHLALCFSIVSTRA